MLRDFISDIPALCAERRMTLQDLALRLDMRKNNLARVLRFEHAPSYVLLDRIAEILCVDLGVKPTLTEEDREYLEYERRILDELYSS